MSDNLMDFFDKPKVVQKTSNEKETILLIDTAQLVFNAKYVMLQELKKKKLEFVPEAFKRTEVKQEETLFTAINLFKHFLINEIMSKMNLFKNVKEVVLALEGGSWRKRYFMDDTTAKTLYKAARIKAREEDTEFDWEKFWEEIRLFQDELKQYFPFITIRSYSAEGDDVIGGMAYYLSDLKPEADIVIISKDKDFIQLTSLSNVRLYNFATKKFCRCENPKDDLLAQILNGDAIDGIPNVWSDRAAFVKKIRQKPLGEKKIWKAITENKVESEILNTPESKIRFEENKKMIDLREMPEEIKNDIIRIYNEEKSRLSSKSQMGLLEYLGSHQMLQIAKRIQFLIKLFP